MSNSSLHKPNRVLFITWDSDQSNYLETLFFPIFDQLQQNRIADFKVVQFSWAAEQEVARISRLAIEKSIGYFHFPVFRNIPSVFGAFLSLYSRRKQVIQLIRTEKIEVLMPRSTMPAWMTLMIKPFLRKMGLKILFDADGLPIQERIDFGTLRSDSFIVYFLRKIERKMLSISDFIMTRSNASIEWHLTHNPGIDSRKFLKVINGRDAQKFAPNPILRKKLRDEHGFVEEDIVLVHSGSLGKAYDLDSVFRIMNKSERLKLLILTRNRELAISMVPRDLTNRVRILSTTFVEIPDFLNACDIGLSLRTLAPSLAGLAPIKLGEYLLSGLRVWVNPEIGDVQQELNDGDCAFFEKPGSDQDCLNWMLNPSPQSVDKCRALGVKYYAMEAALNSYQNVFTKL